MVERSSVVFWLLLAATLVVGLLLSPPAMEAQGDFSGVALDALIIAQLHVICIWSATTTNKNWLSRLAPWLAAVVAAILFAWVERFLSQFGAFAYGIAYYGLNTALVLMALWLVQRTHYWRSKTGIYVEWQFSLAAMLAAMTVVAVMAAVVPKSGFFGEDSPWLSGLMLCCTAMLPVAAVMIWLRPWHWLLRTAAVVAVALILSAVGTVAIATAIESQYFYVFTIFLATHFEIQAIILVLWLGWGLLPASPRSAAAPPAGQQS